MFKVNFKLSQDFFFFFDKQFFNLKINFDLSIIILLKNRHTFFAGFATQ